MNEWLRFGVTALFMLSGLFTLFVSVLGVFRFNFALNRLHSAAIGDTIALLLMCLGLITASGFGLVSVKIAIIVVFMWITGPVSTHLVAKIEADTDPELGRHLVEADMKTIEEETETV